MLWSKTDTPCRSWPFCILLVFSNIATDYRRRQSTVTPTTKLRYNLSGRESDLVIIRMMGSFHLIWKKKINLLLLDRKPTLFPALNGFLFFSLIQCLIWIVTGPVFWYFKEPSDSLFMVGFVFFKSTNIKLSLVSFLIKHIHLCSLDFCICFWSSNWENLQLTQLPMSHLPSLAEFQIR